MLSFKSTFSLSLSPASRGSSSLLYAIRVSLIAQLVKDLPAMQETPVQFLGQEDSPGEGISYPLQYSGLENFMDYTVHGVTNSQT